MRAALKSVGTFQKVGECLYRYSSNGVYYARLKVRGKEIRRSLETIDRDLAKRRLSALKNAMSEIDHSKGRMTLAELCDRYLRTVQHLKPKTVERKTLIVRRIKEEWPSGSPSQVGKIRQSDIQLWLARYDFGPVSRNLHLACLKSILNMAVNDGIIMQSPALAVTPVRLSRPIREAPTWEQFKAILADIRTQQFSSDAHESAEFLEFLGSAGLGQAEATALTWSDIDFERGTIRTFRHKTQSGFEIPIYPQLRRLLEGRRARAGASASQEPVFHQKTARKALAGACRRLGFPSYTQRSLRRMFVTRAIENGADVKVIAEWQGHKDGGKLILDTYSHVNRSHSQRMAQLMVDEEPENVVRLQRGIA